MWLQMCSRFGRTLHAISVGTDRNHLAAFIIAAFGAHMMRPGRLIALRAGCKTDLFQAIVCTPAAAPRSGCFFDWYCHNVDFLLFVAVVYPVCASSLLFKLAERGKGRLRPGAGLTAACTVI